MVCECDVTNSSQLTAYCAAVGGRFDHTPTLLEVWSKQCASVGWGLGVRGTKPPLVLKDAPTKRDKYVQSTFNFLIGEVLDPPVTLQT